MTPSLTYIHFGSFSGSATSLRRALASRTSVQGWDLLAYAQQPALFGARLRAVAEARRAGPGVPFTKTRAWSEAVQRRLEREALRRAAGPVLFVQTLPAFVLNGAIRYAVYTDRVALEGAASPTPFRSRYSPSWLEREAAFLRGAHRIYLMGPSTADVLVREYGVPAARIEVVGAGPNMELGPPGTSTACRRVLFAGIEWERKGGPDLLAAFAEVRREHPELELVIVGGEHREPLPAGVRSVGRVPHAEMDALYSTVDAFVLPSHHDAVPIVLIEALSKGLPCIGTTAGNQQWLIDGGGVIVEPGRPGALASALRALVRDYPAYRRRAEGRGREVRETFRWDRVAERILDGLA
ncbi:MAG: glycosyltransferase family 4 protein [Armatimonadota bacterium]|nr:glycosyltransferase family 4 protein [Armatimonadota bacterium]